MTDQQVTDVMAMLGTVDRSIDGWSWGPLRVERGGGIAGNAHEFWIRFPGSDFPALGPFKRKDQLRKALRAILTKAIQFGNALREPTFEQGAE